MEMDAKVHKTRLLRKTGDGIMLRCPVEDCLKSYEPQGWPAKHVKESHDTLKAHLEKTNERKEHRRRGWGNGRNVGDEM